MPRHSLLEYLGNLERHGSECAYVNRRDYRSERWSYGQILTLAHRVAFELKERSIGKGDRILLWGENSAEWVAVFLGCMLQGVVMVPMDDIASPDFVQRVAEQVGTKVLICSKKHSSSGVALPITTLENIFEDRSEGGERPSPGETVSAVNSDLRPEDTLEIVFTSGTTAEPKGVVITHSNVLANLEPLEQEIRRYLKYERFVHPLRFLNLLPLSHVFGQFLGIFLPQLMGGTVIFQNSLSPSEIMGTIQYERVSVLVAVPRILQSLKEKIERDLAGSGELDQFQVRMRFSEGQHFLRRWWTFRRIRRQFGWKFWAFICGGAALDRATEEFWDRLGYAVVQGYGLTETTSLISVNHPFKLGKGSVGKVLAGREIKLDANGEILVRGGGVASAYWSGKQAQPVAGDQGWYRTGDIGELDEQGNLYFKGRQKDVIVTPAGMNVYPEDLEAALRRQPQVKDCVVIGLDREGNAEACAVLILRDIGDPAHIVAQANEKLADFQRIQTWFIWPEQDFPRTSTQKAKTADIKEAVQSSLGHARAQAATTALAQLISQITGRVGGNLSADSNLDGDLNLNSLDRVQLMSVLEDRYQVDLSETSFASAHTVGDLEKMLGGEAAPRVHYHYPRWALSWPVRWLRVATHYLLLRPAVFLLGWPQVHGREHLNRVRGPVLVVCNHIGDVDVGFVLTALPARLRHHLATAAGGEAMEILRTPLVSKSFSGHMYDRVRWILGAALLNLFPLPRQAGFRQSFEYAGEAVDRGYSVLIFPEGRHTTTGQLLPFRAGIGILVNSLKIPVVPMRIDGLFEVKQSGKKFARRGQISIRIGEPIRFEKESAPAEIAEILQQKIQSL
jgi:long-chain acyl-CoA synthetase